MDSFLGVHAAGWIALAILLSFVACAIATWALCMAIALGQRPMDEIVHACPPAGSMLTPCCSMSPFDLDPAERITNDPLRVTCKGRR